MYLKDSIRLSDQVSPKDNFVNLLVENIHATFFRNLQALKQPKFGLPGCLGPRYWTMESNQALVLHHGRRVGVHFNACFAERLLVVRHFVNLISYI